MTKSKKKTTKRAQPTTMSCAICYEGFLPWIAHALRDPKLPSKSRKGFEASLAEIGAWIDGQIEENTKRASK